MAGFQRSIGSRAIRHGDPTSATHAADVLRNNERRSVYWLAVEQQREHTHRVLAGLGAGMLYVRDRSNGDLLHVSSEEYLKAMNEWRTAVSFYWREAPDKKAKTGKRWKKTRVNGVQGHVVTCSPWWSNCIYEAAERGESEKVREFAERAAVELCHLFQRQTRRRVLSVQAHFDAKNLHWHVFSSRVGPDNKFLHGTTKAIGLIGPWAVGVLRQHEAGMLPDGATNVKCASHYRDKATRVNGCPPVDWMMAKMIDSLCYSTFGVTPRLTEFLRLYKSGLLDSCVDRLLAVGEAISREVATLREGGDYQTAHVGFSRGTIGTEITLQ